MRPCSSAEDKQSNFFRHMVYYSATKRGHCTTSRRTGPAAEAAARLQHALTIGPKDRDGGDLAEPPAAEELGRYTVT